MIYSNEQPYIFQLLFVLGDYCLHLDVATDLNTVKFYDILDSLSYM